MKRYIGFFIILYFFLQLSNITYAQDDRWIFMGAGDFSEMYLDKSSVECDGYGNIDAWLKVYCLADCKEVFGKKVDYKLFKYKYYLGRRKKLMLHYAAYFINSDVFSNEVIGELEDILPETIHEVIYNFIIENYSCK